jgi:hypothetical protein
LVSIAKPNIAAAMGMLPGGLGRSKLSSLEIQTSLAFQELGIVIGVAIVVVILFFLLVSVFENFFSS